MARPAKECQHCRRLAADRKIEWARHYERIAKLIDEALAAGTLIPDPDEPYGPYDPRVPYTEMRAAELAGESMPDVIGYFFRCTSCNRRFSLSCNIYHGGGGAWRVVR